MISSKRRPVLSFCVVITIILAFLFFQKQKIKEFIDLDNIMDIENQISRKNDKIFFIESHLEPLRNFSKFKYACSIESAAKLNPSHQVFLLFATTSNSIKLQRSKIVDALLSYENINFKFIDVIEFAKRTVLEHFMKNHKWKHSKYPMVHLSDILRPMVLNKYGGLYLDLDVLSKTPLLEINRTNFACTQNNGLVVNNIMHFDLNNGKLLTEEFMKKIAIEFDGSSWIGNGPRILTELIKQKCGGLVSKDFDAYCNEFTVFSYKKCNPIYASDWYKYYEEKYTTDVLKTIKDAHFVHFWNTMQIFDHKTYEISYNSKNAYAELAKNFCPKVFETLKEI